MRRIPQGLVLVVAVLILSVVPASPVQARSSLHSKYVCPARMQVCFTLPQVGAGSTTFFGEKTTFVENYFDLNGKMCAGYCLYGGRLNYTSYTVKMYSASMVPSRKLSELALRDLPEDGGTACSSRVRYITVGLVRAATAKCWSQYEQCLYGEENWIDCPKLNFKVAWRYGSQFYWVMLSRAGHHPPARWNWFLRSFEFNKLGVT
jgi:hypothetical protein